MLNSNKVQRQEKEKFERSCRPLADRYYKSINLEIIDRNGTAEFDLRVKENGIIKSIEEKMISAIYDKYISIEIIQDLLTGSPGWILYLENTDWLAWIMFENDKERILIYDLRSLRKWWQENAICYGLGSLRVDRSGEGWTLNQLIPFENILPFLKYDSNKNSQQMSKLKVIGYTTPCGKCKQPIELLEGDIPNFPCKNCGWSP